MKVTNTAPRILNLPGNLSLMPGENEVDDKKFTAAKESKKVQQWISDGLIETSGGSSKSGSKKSDVPDTDDMLAKEAIDAVKAMNDKAALRAMKKGEERVTVLDAIDKRISEL